MAGGIMAGGVYIWGWVLMLAQVLGMGPGTGADAGRRGNALFEQQQYGQAAAAYRRGLRATSDTTGAVYAALQNNLGAALHRQEEFARALQSFERAARASTAPEERERALYNAGNALLGMGDLRSALDYYRRALRAAPASDRARFNYEFVKRQIERRQSGQQRRQQNIEPSPYARRLRKKAEALVGDRKYDAAAALMTEGLRRDSTVAAYRDFIGRIRDVARIAAGSTGTGPGRSMQARPPSGGSQSVPRNRPNQ